MKKVLFISPFKGVGDLIFHLPLMRSIFQKYKCKIFIITSLDSRAHFVLKNEKYISDIFCIDINREKYFSKIYNLIELINKISPDLSILTNSSKRFKIPLLLSKSHKKIFFPKYKNTELCGFLFKKFKILFPDCQITKNYSFNSYDLIKKKEVFVNIDSSHNHNNWSEENYISLINNVFIKKFKKIYINFSPRNKVFFKKISSYYQNKNNIFFTHSYNFKKLIKTISQSHVVVGNESGPNCIAASANVPFVISLHNSKTQKSSKAINKNSIFINSKINNLKIEKKISLHLFKKNN
tara:strand:+ start:670 stop:1554 length:885 start_codon:yes stop_codon:yes gene_type:complete